MLYRHKLTISLLVAFTAFFGTNISGQQPVMSLTQTAILDSIDRRITFLEKQVAIMKKERNAAYLNTMRELGHTQFLRKYHELVADEDFDNALLLIEDGIKKSGLRNDQASVQYYRKYQDDVYSRMKQHRMHYQELFKKEKTLKKEIFAIIEPGTLASYEKAQRMIALALKYAMENNFGETVMRLQSYDAYVKALILDLNSDYDLADLANNAKNFESIFMPLVNNDTLARIREAEKLLSLCVQYGKLTRSSLTGEYFRTREMMVTSATADALAREGREQELVKYTDQSVIASSDTLNPCGVFKWHDKIIVIDEFKPESLYENVKKGEAIIYADKMLATYLLKNQLSKSAGNLSASGTYIIPYKTKDKSSFLYNKDSGKWQFIACYTYITSPSYTAEISKQMPPLYFEDEITAQNPGNVNN